MGAMQNRDPAPKAAVPAPNTSVPAPKAKASGQANRAASAPAVSQRGDLGAGKIQSVGAAENPPAAPAAGAPQSGAEFDTGAGELSLAEKLLSGSGGARNSAAAASLLWKAVGKQNTTAILLLSDLYATGDGVPKSCDQARLLLDAALRKGTPGAANRLQNLQGSCR